MLESSATKRQQEKKATVKSVASWKQRYLKLVENAPLCIHELDTEGRLLSMNPAGLRAMNVPEECQVIGEYFLDFVVGQDRERADVLLGRALGGELVEECELTFATAKGSRRFELVMIPMMDRAGAVQRVICFAQDITDREHADAALRRSEERFRLAQEAAEIGTWDMDVNSGSGTWSDNYWGLYGLAPGDCIPGYQAWLELVHPDDRVRIDDEIRQALEGKRAYKSEFRIVWPDGAVRWLVGQGTVMFNEAGKPVRMIGVDYDITERKKAEQTREEAREQLEMHVRERTRELSEANSLLRQEMADRKRAEADRRHLEMQMLQTQKLESLGVLAGGIAHDFNNLLVAILGNAEMALQKLDHDSPVQPFVKDVSQAAQRAAELTSQMLAFSGKARFTTEAVDLAEVVEQMTHLLQVSISKQISLQFDFRDDLPKVDVDVTQVRQVVMNLITNASEAIGEQRGSILIRCGVLEADGAYLAGTYLDGDLPSGRYVFLQVIDSGQGMDQETREKIFDPFFTTKFTGRGLGLAAVLGIVRGHRGSIKLDSEPGSGSTFTVLFPALADVSASDERPAPSILDWRASGTVLLVDDEESVCIAVSRMLRLWGLEVLTAPGGLEALEVFEKHADEIRLVLLDLTMPSMDGHETHRQLCLIRPDVKVILSSGYSEQEATYQFSDTTLAGFIQKPYRLDQLARKLREVLDQTETTETFQEDR